MQVITEATERIEQPPTLESMVRLHDVLPVRYVTRLVDCREGWWPVGTQSTSYHNFSVVIVNPPGSWFVIDVKAVLERRFLNQPTNIEAAFAVGIGGEARYVPSQTRGFWLPGEAKKAEAFAVASVPIGGIVQDYWDIGLLLNPHGDGFDELRRVRGVDKIYAGFFFPRYHDWSGYTTRRGSIRVTVTYVQTGIPGTLVRVVDLNGETLAVPVGF